MRPDALHTLLVSKASYLEKLECYEDAQNVLDILWEEEEKISKMDVRLNMYEIQSNILNVQGLHEKARDWASQGIQLARWNSSFDCLVELLTVLGDICINLGKYDDAEKSYLLALSLEERVKKKYLLITTNTQLGILYLSQSDKKKAKKYLETATKLCGKDMFRSVAAFSALGEYYLSIDHPKEAESVLIQAFEFAKKLDQDAIKKDILVQLGQCTQKIDKGKFIKYLENSFRLDVQLRKKKRGGAFSMYRLESDPPDQAR
ncbi:tetratricopeptide repeat protein [Risungbinella massiliensis]|uniref:tetratricopeptide repeat protein n=1 Tax=Risungbinella massiliensis TaxID=1329796 RepID=UPI00164E3DD7|nr:tetratricopeptide repeat protein [Risungbinella massiliensis]